MRADATRNVQRLLAAARQAFAERGADASLDDIARRAGVGPGTLYRHFPTRSALVEAVYRDGVANLCATGDRLAATEPPGEALVDWLRALTLYVVEKRGLAKSLLAIDDRGRLFQETHAMINATATALLDGAKAAGAIRSDVEVADLSRLASGIAQACETAPEGSAASERLLLLVFDGLRPRDATP